MFKKAQNDYLEDNSDRKCCDQEIASREQEKNEKQIFEAEKRALVAIKQHFVEWVAVVKIKDTFRVAGRSVHFTVEQLLKQILFFHLVIDIFQRLNGKWEQINNRHA